MAYFPPEEIVQLNYLGPPQSNSNSPLSINRGIDLPASSASQTSNSNRPSASTSNMLANALTSAAPRPTSPNAIEILFSRTNPAPTSARPAMYNVVPQRSTVISSATSSTPGGAQHSDSVGRSSQGIIAPGHFFMSPQNSSAREYTFPPFNFSSSASAGYAGQQASLGPGESSQLPYPASHMVTTSQSRNGTFQPPRTSVMYASSQSITPAQLFGSHSSSSNTQTTYSSGNQEAPVTTAQSLYSSMGRDRISAQSFLGGDSQGNNTSRANSTYPANGSSTATSTQSDRGSLTIPQIANILGLPAGSISDSVSSNVTSTYSTTAAQPSSSSANSSQVNPSRVVQGINPVLSNASSSGWYSVARPAVNASSSSMMIGQQPRLDPYVGLLHRINGNSSSHPPVAHQATPYTRIYGAYRTNLRDSTGEPSPKLYIT